MVHKTHRGCYDLVAMPDYIETCENAAWAGGAVLLDWLGRVDPQKKGPRDLVTQADLASQNAIRDIVLGAFPEHGFVGEEAAESHDRLGQSEFCWVVDPLDGTTNFVHGLPNFAFGRHHSHGAPVVEGKWRQVACWSSSPVFVARPQVHREKWEIGSPPYDVLKH